MKIAVKLAEAGLVPDSIIRKGIRELDAAHLKKYRAESPEELGEELARLIDEMDRSLVALFTEEANIQHYELPAEFFVHVLGRRLKYSCCFFPDGNETLDQAEEKMLELTCRRAGIEPGMKILDLGCGWGSASLYIAEKYDGCTVTSVSNSTLQGDFIRRRGESLGLANVEVLTADINDYNPGKTFDRVISIEMFEHLRNYRELFRRIAGWLNPGGRLFYHIFSHSQYASTFEAHDDQDWIARYFFTGGLMPSASLPLYFQDDLVVERQWLVSGNHYKHTAECWLRNMDNRKEKIYPLIESVYGVKDAPLWLQRWRIFFMAFAELWGYAGGREWIVSHYRSRRRD